LSFDNSRFTFSPWNDYFGVVMQQGRVQLDSDWNEWLAELSRRIQAGTLDIMGRAAYPATTPYAFEITASSPGGVNQIGIGPGRMYVDGLLAENHGDPTAAVWDRALAELSGSPQPPPATETGAIDYTKQPYWNGQPVPAGNGPFLAYLDVWTRPVTYLEDPNLIDKAVGVDTTGRLQTVWQVKLMPVSAATTCTSGITWPAASAGQLTTATTPNAPSGPCCLTDGTGYTGMENQFYRVEIHNPGAGSDTAGLSGATFKWSRDNASVITGVTAITNVTNSEGNTVAQLAVLSLGRDQVLGFTPGNWIEILDDSLELNGKPGELHQIDTIDFSGKTITLTSKVNSFAVGPTNPKSFTRIRRWDQSGLVYKQDGKTVWWDLGATGSDGSIPVPAADTTLILENGITVTFSLSSASGDFNTGDFWTFAARTADGSVETLAKAPPRGIHHHYTQLSIVNFPIGATDCRTKWPPSSGAECGCCCTTTVGDGVESFGQFSSINAAIAALPAAGGEVCILPGRYYEHVFIEGRRDVVLRGCGWQTRIASPSLQPTKTPSTPSTPAAAAVTFAAVITVAASEHIELLSFAVEAATGEVGVLLDGTGTLGVLVPGSAAGATPSSNATAAPQFRGVIDTTIEDLVITASTLPAILAQRVHLLQVEKNRIAMQNVFSQWPAVWVSGAEIRVVHNWVGTQTAATVLEWLPATVAADLTADASATATTTTGVTTPSGTTVNVVAIDAALFVTQVSVHPGGIQIAGPAQDVFVLENEIEGVGRNGITLGGFAVLDATGKDTGQITGVLIAQQDSCSTTATLQPPSTIPGTPGGSLVAGGKLLNIQIDRNRIRNTGLCGIGPVGFFNLIQTLEVISIENLTISSNTISNTLLASIDAIGQGGSLFGYGAICVPDVQNLILRDNTITNFGAQPGLEVSGIFILHGEMVEISRNHVLETRDWSETSTEVQKSANGFRGGIVVVLVTPPTFAAPAAASLWTDSATLSNADISPVYEPGLPALRVEHNVVRVPLGETLAVVGFGPFSIVNNHFSCGGTLSDAATPLAQTVLILNLGTAIETTTAANTFTGSYNNINASGAAFQTANQLSTSSGAVMFTNNLCQLVARATRARAFTSVLILSLDHLNFSSNHCWIDGKEASALLDAMLLAGSIQVTDNRFQESPGFAVLASGVTVGVLNITTENISTYCLFAEGTMLVNTNNLSIIPASACAGSLKGQ